MHIGALDILIERCRQIDKEGWSDDHDDQHSSGQLWKAALCYIFPQLRDEGFWPWDEKWWKPKKRRADLVKAGALIAAEIDRMDRKGLA